MSAAGCRPRVLATDVILDVGASLKVISQPRLRLFGTSAVRIPRISEPIV
jgi:hypothetical protein